MDNVVLMEILGRCESGEAAKRIQLTASALQIWCARYLVFCSAAIKLSIR